MCSGEETWSFLDYCHPAVIQLSSWNPDINYSYRLAFCWSIGDGHGCWCAPGRQQQSSVRERGWSLVADIGKEALKCTVQVLLQSKYWICPFIFYIVSVWRIQEETAITAFSICVSYVCGGVMGLAAECMRMAWLCHQKHNICYHTLEVLTLGESFYFKIPAKDILNCARI